MVAEDGSRVACSTHSVSLPGGFSVCCLSDSTGRDAPSSMSTSCVRADEVMHDVQMKTILRKTEIFRFFEDDLPSLFAVTDGGFSVLLDVVALPCDTTFPLFRKLRDLTGMVKVVGFQEPWSFPLVSSFSPPV